MRSWSIILEVIVQFLFPFQSSRLKCNVHNNSINQSLLPCRSWNTTPISIILPLDYTFEGSKIVSRYLSQNISLLWPSFSICFEIQAVQCTVGLPMSPRSVEKEIKLHCKITNIRSTRYRWYDEHCKWQVIKYSVGTGYSALVLTVQRRPSIAKISSFSYCLRHEDGLLTLSGFSGLVPDIISKILYLY